MKIALVGTRGVPNNYGGFEQFAEFISVKLVQRGHTCLVMNPHYHNYSKSDFHGAIIKKIFHPEKTIGPLGSFVYDYLSLREALKSNCDVIIALGYAPISLFYRLFNFKKTVLFTNMDGLEWKRDKWNWGVKLLLKWLEKLAAKRSHHLIADNVHIQSYLKDKHNRESHYIPYGTYIFDNPEIRSLEQHNVKPFEYNMLIARLEVENNVDMICQGFTKLKKPVPLLVVGNNDTKYGNYLKDKYRKYSHIQFVGSLYNLNQLNNLRYFAQFYFHGHSVGGTNPSLLEAMGSQAFIAAHNNEFNKSVLEEGAFYFSSSDDVSKIVSDYDQLKTKRAKHIDYNLAKIESTYDWDKITDLCEKILLSNIKSTSSIIPESTLLHSKTT